MDQSPHSDAGAWVACADRPPAGGAAGASAVANGHCSCFKSSGCEGSSSAPAPPAACPAAAEASAPAASAPPHKLDPSSPAKTAATIPQQNADAIPKQNADEVLLVKKQLATLLLLNCRERRFRQRERASEVRPHAAQSGEARCGPAASRPAKRLQQGPRPAELVKLSKWAREEESRIRGLLSHGAPTSPTDADSDLPAPSAPETPSADGPVIDSGGFRKVLASMSPAGLLLNHNSAHLAVAYYIFRQQRNNAPAHECNGRTQNQNQPATRAAHQPPTAAAPLPPLPPPGAPPHQNQQPSEQQYYLQSMLSQPQYLAASHPQHFPSGPRSPPVPHAQPMQNAQPIQNAQPMQAPMQTPMLPMAHPHQAYGQAPQVRGYHPPPPQLAHMPHHLHPLPPLCDSSGGGPAPHAYVPAAAHPYVPAAPAGGSQGSSAIAARRLQHEHAVAQAQARALAGHPAALEPLPPPPMPMAYMSMRAVQPFSQMEGLPRVAPRMNTGGEARPGGPAHQGAAGAHGMQGSMHFY